MTLGERIVEIRKKRGMSQKKLAEKLNISPTRLNYWEKDKRFPPIPMINAISAALQVDANYLIGQSEIEKNSTPANADMEDVRSHINLLFTQFLIEAGYIDAGSDISERDAAFLISLVGMIDAWFQK